MTTAEITTALEQIAAGGIALPAAIEYELEDLGLITTDDGPYAKLTDTGRVHLATHRR